MRALAVVAVVLAAGTAAGAGVLLAGPGSSPADPAGVPGSPTQDGPPPFDSSPTDPAAPAIVAVHANPVADEDRGEYVVVTYPGGAGWTLSDGETTVRLPGGADRAVVTPDPRSVDATGRVVHAPDLRLSNAGERLRLHHGAEIVDAVAYEDAPDSEILDPHEGEWHPVGATDFAPRSSGPAAVEAFVLPDAPGVVVETIGAADRRVLLAGYTFASWEVARALVTARERGATVRVLLEGGPVGGITRRQARVMDWLVDQGVPVAVFDGPRSRYAFHHPKYAVVDDRALVLTENFKPAGTGGHASRGWGAVVYDPGTAADLAAVFRADAGWRDTVDWRTFRADYEFVDGGAANGSYPRRFRPRRLQAERVSVVVAPDNAEAAILDLLRGARESVLVQQVSVGGRRQPFMQATVAAARRGVRVRVLLSSAWYVEEDNRRLVAWLNGLADREGLPLAARLAEPRSRYGKVHAKGLVVDGEVAVVGSVNWNNHSARENREVALVLEGEAVGRYYARAFRSDWRGGTRRLPVGVGAAVVLAAGGAALAARAVTFRRGW